LEMKKKMALALITVLSISTLTLSVFADTPVIRGISEASVQETQTEQSEGKSSGNSVDEKSSDSETGEKTDDCRGHGKHRGRPDEEQVEEPENAIGNDAAESKALDDAGVSEDQAGRVMSHLSRLDDGTVVYRVDFICSDQHYSYQVNATSGEIVEKKNEAVSEDRLAGPGGRHDRENNSATADSFTETASDVA